MTVYTRDAGANIVILNQSNSTIADATLKLIELTWGLAESAAPYATASVTIPPPSASVWAMLDPGARRKLYITEYIHRLPTDFLGHSHGAVVSLRVYRRDRNADGSVSLLLVGPEQDLIDYFPAAVDTSNWARQGDVTQIIRAVLTKVYGAEGAGWLPLNQDLAADQQLSGTFLTYRAATNLIPNGSFEYGTTGWTSAGATLSRITGWRQSGTYALSVNPTNTGTDSFAQINIDLQPNTTYTLNAWIRTGGSPQVSPSGYARRALVVVSVGGVARVHAMTPQAGNTANITRLLAVTFTTPSIMDSGGSQIRLFNGAAAGALYFDAVSLFEGDGTDTDGATPIGYFDGDTVDGTAGYNYDWQGDAGNSASTRTPVVDRDPDTLTWKPGQSAWDFLTPILESVGGRLFSYGGYNASSTSRDAAPSYLWVNNRAVFSFWAIRAVEGDNLYNLTQLNDLGAEFSDGTPMYADAVVIRYEWTDNLGVQHEAFDAYPTTGYTKPWLRELNEPYPGAGRARGLYLRLRARASVLELTIAYDPSLIPASQMSVTSSLIGGSALSVIDSVTHDPFNGTSTIRTKATISYPTNAWVTKTTPWTGLTGSWAAQ